MQQEEYALIRVWNLEDFKWNEWLVIPETVSRYTGMTEFVVTDKTINNKLFEGDIVEVLSRRRPLYEPIYKSASQYDSQCKARAVIKWSEYQGMWILDYDNDYNKNLTKLKGNETNDRTVEASTELYSYGCHLNDEKWYRKNNSHYKWADIVKIGNIFDNSLSIFNKPFDCVTTYS